ncbi:hypothetical protein C8R41DRAFT_863081 [Lentinula lateritia]|uniref:Uncharacterized protein n=1 Tax=Lentinula lateritia TaxID=40482 RepID=A0ABQ8VVT1_9AGAR|nr:hypothetical protein C8R41DRAFT_863081 [Lentinula lateritia]
MCSSQLTNAPLFTTNFISVPPITGKGPSTRRLLFTNEAPQLFMLIDSNTISSFSSDPLMPLSSSECAHLTSFDPIPSTPPPTVSLGVETSYYLQALQDNYEDVRHDAVTQCLVADTGKDQEWEHYPTPRGPVARTKDSSSTSKAALDVRTVAFDVVRKFPINDCDKSSEDSFICCKTTDKNRNTEDYMQAPEGHHPSPSSGDTVLSCWKTGRQVSYHGCDLRVFSPIPCQRGSLTIPNRKHDPIVHQHVWQCYAPRLHSKVLMPDPLNIPQVQMKEVEDLEKVKDRLATGVPAGSLLFSI